MEKFIVDAAFAQFITEKTHTWLKQYRDHIELEHRTSTIDHSAISRVRTLLGEPRPLDRIQSLNRQVLDENRALRSPTQRKMFQAGLLSSMLSAFPLRRSHWLDMRITSGQSVASNPQFNSLHVFPQPIGGTFGKYALAVPVSTLKNGVRSSELRKRRRVVANLPRHLDDDITWYLDEHRSHWAESSRGGPLFDIGPTGVVNRLNAMQLKYMVRPLGIERPFGFHSYRAIVATHLIKTGGADAYRMAASLLLDTEEMVREAYSDFRPEDLHHLAQEAIAPEGLAPADDVREYARQTLTPQPSDSGKK